jgi:hypothetical protein
MLRMPQLKRMLPLRRMLRMKLNSTAACMNASSQRLLLLFWGEGSSALVIAFFV